MCANREPTKGGEQVFVTSVPGPHGPGTFVVGLPKSDIGSGGTVCWRSNDGVSARSDLPRAIVRFITKEKPPERESV